MSSLQSIPEHMDADAFLPWALNQPGRWELESGRVLAQANETLGHVRRKGQIYERLRAALREAGSSCTALQDGMNVRVDTETVFCPDAMVRCGDQLPDDVLEILDPMILVEVTSRSSETRDIVVKLPEYFRIPSLQHYLVVSHERPLILHFSRGGNTIETRFVRRAPVRLDPPGIVLDEWWPEATDRGGDG